MNAGLAENAFFRVLTYSHDGFGMGHVRRNINITAQFLKEVPGSSVLMLVGCSPEAYFELPEGVDFIKMPSIVKVATGVHRPARLPLAVEHVKALRESIIMQAAEVYRPQVVLVDYVAAGVWGELGPTLRRLKELSSPPIIALGLREIIDVPAAVRQRWQREGTFDLINRYYDTVLIYGTPDVFDTAHEYGLDRELATSINYCGYVCSEEGLQPAEKIREELGARENEKLLVVTGGGGRDGFPMMRACIQALPLVRKETAVACALIAGPLMNSAQKESLREEAQAAGIRFLDYVSGSSSYLNAADLVVSMAGYNSLSDILRLGKKALVIPRIGPSAEQTMRAELFARRGLVDTLSPWHLSPERLAAQIRLDLERDDFPAADRLLDMTGARNAATRLIRLAATQTVLAAERSETTADAPAESLGITRAEHLAVPSNGDAAESVATHLRGATRKLIRSGAHD